MKHQIAQLKGLEEDCQSIQQSLAIIQASQRMMTFYTADERQRLILEYKALLTAGAKGLEQLDVFRQDHPDIALITEVLVAARAQHRGGQQKIDQR